MASARARKALFEITETAAKRIKDLMARKPQPCAGVRIAVKTRGCNGLTYAMNYTDKPIKGDEHVSQHGVNVFIEPKSVMFLVGTKMDFKEDDLSAKFTFDNPNAKSTCGCGDSFST